MVNPEFKKPITIIKTDKGGEKNAREFKAVEGGKVVEWSSSSNKEKGTSLRLRAGK